MTTPTGPRSFEEAFAQLERIVQRLEQGNLSLEESTRLYEEGIALARLCNELLTRAEARITHLQTSYGNRLSPLQGQDAPGRADDTTLPPSR
jgi:exodeoxyribonuclease VII small subunit